MVILDADSTTSELWEDTKLLFSNAAAICTHTAIQRETKVSFILSIMSPSNCRRIRTVSKKIADTLGMDNFDDTTYQAERLMHKPSHSKGGDYFSLPRWGMAKSR